MIFFILQSYHIDSEQSNHEKHFFMQKSWFIARAGCAYNGRYSAFQTKSITFPLSLQLKIANKSLILRSKIKSKRKK